jgi:hypothetical protein
MRPSTWKSHFVTKPLRVPYEYADRLLALAHWWDTGGHAHAPEPLTAAGVDHLRAHLDTFSREQLIDEIVAFRSDQYALWARLAAGEKLL